MMSIYLVQAHVRMAAWHVPCFGFGSTYVPQVGFTGFVDGL